MYSKNKSKFCKTDKFLQTFQSILAIVQKKVIDKVSSKDALIYLYKQNSKIKRVNKPGGEEIAIL